MYPDPTERETHAGRNLDGLRQHETELLKPDFNTLGCAPPLERIIHLIMTVTNR